MNIRTRLFIIFMFIATAFIAGLVYNYVAVAKRASLAVMSAKAEATADMLADQALACITSKSPACWDKISAEYSKIENLGGVTIADPAGNTLHSYLRMKKSVPAENSGMPDFPKIEISRFIANRGVSAGKLTLWLTIRGYDLVSENSIWRAVSTGLVFWILLGILLWLASAKLADDMRLLVAAAEKLEGQDMPSLPAASPESDVGRLSASFRTIHKTIAEEKHLRTESEELNRDFFAMTVHDLKQPITVIKAVNELISEAIEAGKYGKNEMDRILYLANDSVERLSRMVEDILNITKLSDRSLPVQKERVNLGTLVKDIVAENCVVVERSSRKWSTDCAPELGRCFVYGDDILIRRVIGNLVLNAIHYTPEGGEIRFGAKLLGDNVVLSVSDTGRGIPEKFRADIFEKYKSLSKTAKNVGLGLAFCKLVADRHAAKLEVKSSMGKGTEISFILPSATE